MTTALQKSAQGDLRRIVEHIERLESEKKSLSEDIKDKYDECRNKGFDVKIVRKVIAMRKMDKTDRHEQEALIQTYLHALGDLADLPLGQWAVNQASAGILVNA